MRTSFRYDPQIDTLFSSKLITFVSSASLLKRKKPEEKFPPASYFLGQGFSWVT